MSDSATLRVLRVLLRGWWLILMAAILAGVVAFISFGGGEVTYLGSAALTIDTAIVSRYPALPVPELLLSEVQSAEFKQQVLDAAGVSGGSLSFYTLGNPQRLFYATYLTDSEEEAEHTVDVAANMVIETYLEMGEQEIGRLETALEEAYEMLGYLEAGLTEPSFTPQEVLGVHWQIYSVENSIIANEALLDQQRAAYSYAENPSVTMTDPATEQRRNVLAAALLGLVLGAVVVLVRSRVWQTPTEG